MGLRATAALTPDLALAVDTIVAAIRPTWTRVEDVRCAWVRGR